MPYYIFVYHTRGLTKFSCKESTQSKTLPQKKESSIVLEKERKKGRYELKDQAVHKRTAAEIAGRIDSEACMNQQRKKP
jgi:hypothetical protein